MSAPDFAILAEDLVRVYRRKSSESIRALDGLSLSVRRGEIFGLLGRNGAGKTTLLRILTTLIPPTSGRASVMGRDVVEQSLDVRRQICFVLQEDAAEVFLSVEDNLATYARFHSLLRTEYLRRVGPVLERFGLQEYRRRRVIDLSGGLKRRVQVAKIFLIDAPLIFLDEATTGMDPFNKRITLDALREEADRGRTIFLTTHMLQEAEELCDTIAIIDRGRLVAAGDLPTIKSLVPRAYDVMITFDSIDAGIEEELRRLPAATLSRRHNTIDMSLRGDQSEAMGLISRLSASGRVVHCEVTGASLEDVFLELLGRRAPPSAGASPEDPR